MEFLVGVTYVGSLITLATVSGLVQYWEVRAWANDPNRSSSIEEETSTNSTQQQTLLEEATWLAPPPVKKTAS